MWCSFTVGEGDFLLLLLLILARQTDPGLKSGICVWANFHFKKNKKNKKKAQAGNEWLNILPKSSQVRKKLPHLFQLAK